MHEHRPDVESDLSVFHRIDDLTAVHPQRLIDLAVRLGYYPGAVQAQLRSETTVDGPADSGGDRTVDSTSVSLAVDPVLGGLIDFA